MSILAIAILILCLPVAMFGVLALFHNRIPRHGDFLAILTLGACLLFSTILFFKAFFSDGSTAVWGFGAVGWLAARAGNALSSGILVDNLTAAMLVVVTLISFLVHLFSVKYMEGDVRYGRYYCGLLFFTASMVGVVLASDLLWLYMSWELVGLSSYILIGHWYEKKSASDAAIKAFITTRIGDVGMLIGLLICYWKVGSLQYADLFAAVQTGGLAGGWHTIAGLGIFFGAMGKSAQFPLHVWLPDAMEGPTPVSALIHAATMVAAGVYLTARMLPFFDSTTLVFIAYIGGFTALFAATIAVVQDDIKKVLAYSTVSQLGYMVLGLGVGGYVSGMFHLTTHAFFKAGLFLGSGAVIYAMHHEQSMSRYGGLRRKMPVTTVCYLLATLALVGFPGFSGFWSKDAILADSLAYAMLHPIHAFLPIAGFVTVFLTAFYMFRQFFLTFTGKPRDSHAYEHAREAPWQMLVPLIVLGALAVVGGGFGGWFGAMNPKRGGEEQVDAIVRSGYVSTWTSRLSLSSVSTLSTESTPSTSEHGESAHGPEVEALHKAHYIAMGLSTILGLSGIGFGALFYFERRNGRALFDPARVAARFAPIHRLLWNKYYLDEIYMLCFVMSFRGIAWLAAWFDRLVIDSIVNFFGLLGVAGSWIVEIFDRYVVDGLGVNGAARVTALLGEGLSFSETGRVRQYIVSMVTGLLVAAGACAFAYFAF
ncbi:NADH-quinone oxidoreductase subunit L [Candidatus Sumerlaeota bacterium]|nr:NADH-quinone oxidoreductase subunit L [Candidatus Sumerlaeota bacterium]